MRGLYLAAFIVWASSAQAQNGPVDLSNGVVAPPTGLPRTLAARAADTFNVKDYGALGTGTATTIGTSYGLNNAACGSVSTAPACLAAFAAYTTPSGATPFAWATNSAFGLTFQMTPTGSSATTVQTFIESLGNNFLGWNTNGVALWQDPANASYILASGMSVSGCGLPNGTTIQIPTGGGVSIGRTPGVTASGSGSSAVAGYGQIILTAAPSAACTTPLTFTIAPAQLQALTLDWLGIQTAMAQAWLGNFGGHVHIPGGQYWINHSLVNAASMTDINQNTTRGLDIGGDGEANTRISTLVDLGTDACVFTNATRGYNYSTNTHFVSDTYYHNFRLDGPGGWTLVRGQAPNNLDGICITAADKISDVTVSGMHAGVNTLNDHWMIHKLTATNNGYGIYFAPFTSTMGNDVLSDVSDGGNTIASIAVSTSNQIDSAIMRNLSVGFNPYGFYREARTANITSQMTGFITQSELDYVFVEAIGQSYIYGEYASCYGSGFGCDVGGNTFVGGDPVVAGDPGWAILDQTGKPVPAKALVYVSSFNNNVLLNTKWGFAYGSVTDGLIETVYEVQGNDFIDDNSLIFGATA